MQEACRSALPGHLHWQLRSEAWDTQPANSTCRWLHSVCGLTMGSQDDQDLRNLREVH